MREIVFDTETTGLSFNAGHRLVEIGCVELVNRVPTGRSFHRYLNPDRDMPVEAFAVHGLSEAFLADKPRFPEVCDELIEFLGDCPLIAHNAMFDFGFINGELGACGRPLLQVERIVETVIVQQPVRQKLPRKRVSNTFSFRVADCHGYVTVGEFEDGRPGEIFLKVAKRIGVPLDDFLPGAQKK